MEDIDIDDESEPDVNSFILEQIELDKARQTQTNPEDELIDGLAAPREINLDELPTRRELMGYKLNPTHADVRRRVPDWAKHVICPVCGYTTVPLKTRPTKWGECITYQCHREVTPRVYCLAVVQVTVGSPFWLRAGDFISSDYDWKEVAEETTLVLPGDRVVQSQVTQDFELPERKPPNPWERRGVQSHVVWDVLWESLVSDGCIEIAELVERVQKRRPKDKSYPGLRKLMSSVDYIPSWVTKRSGFVIKEIDRTFYVKGKTQGDVTKAPYSSELYRKEFRLGEYEGDA